MSGQRLRGQTPKLGTARVLASIPLVALLLRGSAGAAPVIATLDNGLKVCIAEENSSDIVAVQIVIHATADCEPDDKAGLRTVLQHALRAAADKKIEGNEDLGFLLDMEDSRGGLSITSDLDYVAMGYSGTSDTLRPALAFMAEAVFAPEITEETFAAARDVVKRAAAGPASAPAASTISLFCMALFNRASRAYPLGTPKTLDNLSVADLNAFRRRYYVPSLAAVAIVGPVQSAQAQQLVTESFGRLPAGDPALPALPEASPEDDVRVGGSPELVAPGGGGGDIASLVIGVPAPGLGDPDEAVTYVVHALLGGGDAPGGRINKDRKLWEALGLRIPEGTERTHCFVESLPPPTSARSHLAIHAYIAPRQAEASKNALLGEFRSLADKEPGAEELQRAKQYVAGTYGALFDEPMNRALVMGRAVALGFADTVGASFSRRAMAVTPKDVQRVAKAYFGRYGGGIEFAEEPPQ
ncbi:MAG: insulinase family protein [Armatimonadetes bacterium]|nr:insulinase family protein [Armatimonadota bacterium]